MERITYRITLDAHKSGIQRTLQGFETADNMARRIAVTLSESGEAVELPEDNIAAVIYVTTPNATEPSINACTIEEGVIVYDLLPIVEEGSTEMQIKIIETRREGAQRVLMSARFAVEVSRSNADDGSAEQTTTFTALENALARAQSAYEERLLRIEIDKSCVFRAYYADGSVYENYYLHEMLFKGSALMCESWTRGGTGIREGEDTDNAMYYSNVSRSASKDADMVASTARLLLEEAILYSHYTVFRVDFESGELSYVTASYEFDVNEETGHLDVTGEKNFDLEKAVDEVAEVWFTEASDRFETEMKAELSEERGSLSAYTKQIKTEFAEEKNELVSFSEQIKTELEAEKKRFDEVSEAVDASAADAASSAEDAKFYLEQSKSISESFAGALRPMGTVEFSYLSLLSNIPAGDMYNISNAFVTTEEFKEGAGVSCPAGSNVYRTSDGFWDVLAGSPVTGIKGAKEEDYRRGNVNISPEDIGAATMEDVQGKILETLSEVSANTEEKKIMGAKAGKELYEKLGGLSFVAMTQAEYDALPTKDADTIYFTTE